MYKYYHLHSSDQVSEEQEYLCNLRSSVWDVHDLVSAAPYSLSLDCLTQAWPLIHCHSMVPGPGAPARALWLAAPRAVDERKPQQGLLESYALDSQRARRSQPTFCQGCGRCSSGPTPYWRDTPPSKCLLLRAGESPCFEGVVTGGLLCSSGRLQIRNTWTTRFRESYKEEIEGQKDMLGDIRREVWGGCEGWIWLISLNVCTKFSK